MTGVVVRVREDAVECRWFDRPADVRGRRGLNVPRLLVVVAVGLIIGVVPGCERGCPGGEQPAEISFSTETNDHKLVAVARLGSFEMRHFDAQHWIAEGVEAGVFRDRDDLEHGIPETPTGRLQELFEDVFGQQSGRLDWSGHVDAVVWRPEADGGSWRWALTIPKREGPALERLVDWPTTGRIVPEGDGDDIPVYEPRSGEEATPLRVAEVPAAVPKESGRQAWMISNFDSAPGLLDDAIERTGDSGGREAELYVWPRRSGVADRHAEIAAILEEELATSSRDVTPARLGLNHLMAQVQHTLASPESWPETIRVAKNVDRDEETDGARRVEFVVDVETESETWLSEVAEALDGREGTRRARIGDDGTQLDARLRPGGARDLADAIPETWWRVVAGGSAGDVEPALDHLRGALREVDGHLTVARFESPLPVGLTGELYVDVETSDGPAFRDSIAEWHEWLVDQYWLVLLDLHAEFIDVEEPVELDDRDVRIRQQGFHIGHGFGTGGVCHLTRQQRWIAYYGVRPCDRLRELVDWSEPGQDGAPASLRTSLQQFVDTVYGVPGEKTRRVFGDTDLDLAVEPVKEDVVRLSTEFEDLAELGRLIEGVPRLGADWRPERLVDTDGPVQRVSLERPTFQEPGVTAVGIPGFGGPLPGSFALGMPFSYPPVSPRLYRQHFFGEADRQPGHDHHHHHHDGHDHSH